MPQNIPYPGESMEEFQRRMNAQGRVDPLAYGTLRPPQAPPQIMQRGERDAAGNFSLSPAPDSPFIRATQEALAGGGATTYPLNPQQSNQGGDGQNSSSLPSFSNPLDFYSYLFGEGFSGKSEDVQYTNPASNMAVNPTGDPMQQSDANISFGSDSPWGSGSGIEIPIPIPGVEVRNGELGLTLNWPNREPGAIERAFEWLPPESAQRGMPFGGPAQTEAPQAGAGAGGRDSSGFQRDMYSPIPPAGEEVIDDSPMPQLRREQVEEFIRQMQGTAPGEFERDDIDGSRILASMGQALAGAGQTPTVGEALLSLGTGGTSAVAQHEEEQRQLQREHSQNQREFQRQLAEQAFAGEQALLQSEQQARQFDMKLDQAIAQQDAKRMDALGRQSGLKVSGDNIVITKPKLDENGEPTNQTSVEVINTDQQHSLLDAAAIGGKAENISLPEIGGFDPATTLAGVSEDGQADIVTSANLEAGAIPLSRIQDPRVQQRIQQVRQQAEKEVISKYAGENEIESLTQLAGMGGIDIGKIQDEVELKQWRAIVDEMGRNPVVRYSIWQASGNPQLRRIADPALQQYREQFDNGSQ